MKVDFFSLIEYASLSALVRDFLSEKENLKPLVLGFQNIKTIEKAISQREDFDLAKRQLLVDVLLRQNKTFLDETLNKNLNSLLDASTFTVTTGHQLCLATGPMYSIYKIASTIALSRDLKEKFPEKNFIPVFWLASEDHDVEEINHFYLFNRKIEWQTDQSGPVGRFNTKGIDEIFNALNLENNEWISKLSHAYSSSQSLAEAHRKIIYEIFGTKELIVVDGDNPEFKQSFASIMQEELLNQPTEERVLAASTLLESMGYKAQVFPRPINLFWMDNGKRERIKSQTEGGNESSHWQKLLSEQPSNFSPNVILRPVYQEFLLPNIAYIGGPGELSYWMQLQSVFEYFKVPFPSVLLRDSAIVVNTSTQRKMEKLGLKSRNLFQKKIEIINSWLQEKGLENLDLLKTELSLLYEKIEAKAKEVEITLQTSAAAEKSKAITGVENLEKKMVKAQKQKEEVRIQQLDKLFIDVFPDGEWQERKENMLRFISDLGNDPIESLIKFFNPLDKTVKIIYCDNLNKIEE